MITGVGQQLGHRSVARVRRAGQEILLTLHAHALKAHTNSVVQGLLALTQHSGEVFAFASRQRAHEAAGTGAFKKTSRNDSGSWPRTSSI